MKCYNCRSEVSEGMSFCPNCGSLQKFTELIQRANNNDQIAIEQLYKMTYNNVYQTIRMIANLDEDTVFDLLQNTYIKAFKNLSQLKEPEAFRGWIKTIARNLTIDYLRKKKAITFSQIVSIDSDEMIDFEDESVQNQPEAVIDRNETTNLLGQILGELTEEQRIAIHMYYFEELSIKEISEILGASEGTIKSRLNYGRKKIEEGVKALEKKGTKLYGLAPIPFLLFLFKGQHAYAAEVPNTAVLQAVQKDVASGISRIAGSAAKATAQETAKAFGAETVKTTIGSVGKNVLAKAVAGVTTVAVIGTSAAVFSSMNEKFVAGDSLSNATSIPIDERITGTIEGQEEDWYSFRTGNEPNTVYNITVTNTTVNGQILYMELYTKDEKNIGHDIADHHGKAETIRMNGVQRQLLEPDTVYYIQVTTYGWGEANNTEYSLIVKDPNSETSSVPVTGEVIEAQNLSECEDVNAGTNQTEAAILPFGVKVSGTVLDDEAAWFAFKTEEAADISYSITFENHTENSYPLSVSIYDEFGENQRPGENAQNGEGPVTLIKDKLDTDEIYYIRLKSSDTLDYTLIINTQKN